MLVLDAEILSAAGLDDPDAILTKPIGTVVKAAVPGHEVRHIDGVGAAGLFIKRVHGADVREVSNEWRILSHLARHGIPAPLPVALVERRKAAGIVTRGIPVAATLEERLVRERGPGDAQDLLRRLALLVRDLHDAGVNHRDLYIGHILIDSDACLWLVDLGRAEKRRRVPRYRIIKDLAALDFSTPARIAGDAARLRFLRRYAGKAIQKRRLRALARAVRRKSLRMRRHAERKIARGDTNIHVNT